MKRARYDSIEVPSFNQISLLNIENKCETTLVKPIYLSGKKEKKKENYVANRIIPSLNELPKEEVKKIISTLENIKENPLIDSDDEVIYSCDTCCHYPCRCGEENDFLNSISKIIFDLGNLKCDGDLEFNHEDIK